MRLGFYAVAQPFDCSLDSAGAVLNAQGTERHLYDAECPEYPRSIDVTHVRDPESIAVQLAKPASKRDATLEIAVVVQQARIASIGQEHSCYRIGTLAGFGNVEPDCRSLLPN